MSYLFLSKISAKSETPDTSNPEQKMVLLEPVKPLGYEIDGNLIVNGNVVITKFLWLNEGKATGRGPHDRQQLIDNSESVETLGSSEANVEKIQKLEKSVADLEAKLLSFEDKFEELERYARNVDSELEFFKRNTESDIYWLKDIQKQNQDQT